MHFVQTVRVILQNKPRVSYHSPRSTAGSGTGIIKGGFFMVVAIGVGYGEYSVTVKYSATEIMAGISCQ